jgi:hypothetical protein
MTHVEVGIRFTTSFLGGGPREAGVRRLLRDERGRIIVPRSVTEPIKGRGVILEPWIDPEEVSVLSRIYNKVRVDKFEGIRHGTSCSLFCSADADGDELHSLVNGAMYRLGSIGISQWGLKFNCGRFRPTFISLR